MSRTGWYAGLALAAALVTGGALGFALGRAAGKRSALPRKTEVLSDVTLLGLSRQALLDSLTPTPAQRAIIDSLIDDAARRAEAGVERLVTDVRALTAQARRQVRAALEPPQQEKFDSLLSGIPQLLPRTPVPPRRR